MVDPSFLDLVRLGVLPADDPAVVNTLGVVDAQLGVPTRARLLLAPRLVRRLRREDRRQPWEFGLPDGSLISRGRAWPLLNGERGEYEIAAGDLRGAAAQLATMARARRARRHAARAGLGPAAPGGRPGFEPGTPTFSATPLAWTHAQYLRLARDAEAGRVLEQPAVVADRYLR